MVIQHIPVEVKYSKSLLSLHKNKSVLPSGGRNTLDKKQKTSSNKEYNPKTDRFTQDIETYIKQAKIHKNKYNTNDNDEPSTNSPYKTSTEENQSSFSDNENDYDEKPRHKHGKPVNVSHHLHSNSETDSDQIYGGTTDASTTHYVSRITFQFLIKIFFCHYKRCTFVQMLSILFWHHSKI